MLYYVLHVVVSLITVSAIEQKPLSVSQPQCGKNKRIILLDRRSRSSIMGSGANLGKNLRIDSGPVCVEEFEI